MHYVVNPWIFYLFNLLSKLNVLFVALSMFSGVIMVFLTPIWWEIIESDYKNEESRIPSNTIKMIKTILTVFIVSIFGIILIPDKNTCKEMLVASYATEENIDYSKETIKDAIDYIFEKIENKEETNE